jgi:hypothetical protein
MAKKHKKALGGANHYAEKLARLKAEAAVALRELGSRPWLKRASRRRPT